MQSTSFSVNSYKCAIYRCFDIVSVSLDFRIGIWNKTKGNLCKFSIYIWFISKLVVIYYRNTVVSQWLTGNYLRSLYI